MKPVVWVAQGGTRVARIACRLVPYIEEILVLTGAGCSASDGLSVSAPPSGSGQASHSRVLTVGELKDELLQGAGVQRFDLLLKRLIVFESPVSHDRSLGIGDALMDTL